MELGNSLQTLKQEINTTAKIGQDGERREQKTNKSKWKLAIKYVMLPTNTLIRRNFRTPPPYTKNY